MTTPENEAKQRYALPASRRLIARNGCGDPRAIPNREGSRDAT